MCSLAALSILIRFMSLGFLHLSVLNFIFLLNVLPYCDSTFPCSLRCLKTSCTFHPCLPLPTFRLAEGSQDRLGLAEFQYTFSG